MKLKLHHKTKRGWYAGFDSLKGSPVFNRTSKSGLDLSESDAEIVIRQLKLLGVTVEPDDQ